MPDLHETITEGEITVPIEIKDSFGNFTINEEIATGATHDGRRFRVLWCFPMGLKIELLDEDGHAEVSAMPDLRAVINESVTALLSASAARNDPEELGVVDDESVTIEESGG